MYPQYRMHNLIPNVETVMGGETTVVHDQGGYSEPRGTPA
jgi:hypothetical protein